MADQPQKPRNDWLRRFPPIALVREVFKEAPLSKSYFAVMVVVGLLLWVDMTIKDINLIIAGVSGSIILYVASKALLRLVRQFIFWLIQGMLRILVWREIIPEENAHVPKQLVQVLDRFFNKWVNVLLLFFWIAFMTAFFYSSVISGDWPSAGKGIPSACFGYLHSHHWQWASVCSVLVLLVLATHNVAALKRYGKICFAVGALLLFLVGIFFVTHGWFTLKSGFWITYGILGTYALAMGVLLRSKEIISRWYRLFLIASLGVSLGIATQGIIVGIFKNYPGPLIMWDKSGCEARRSNGIKVQ